MTELRNAIKEAQQNKERAEQSYNEVEQIYNSNPMGMGLISREMVYLRLNEQLAAINGEPLERHKDATIRDIIPDIADQTEQLVRTVFESGEAIRGQQITGSNRVSPDDQRIWESDWVPYWRDGKVDAVAVTVRDVTEIVETERNLRKLMEELEHRVKNMLANIGALVNQARREAKSDADVYDKLTHRIEALAKTHALLTAEQWSSAALRDVISPETVDIYGEDRVELKGPDLRVNSQTSLALGMAIHEMATNAAKYGAFSKEDGVVSITWSRINDDKGDRLVIKWEESGGPKVKEPEKRGFGSQMIRSTLQGTLDGDLSINWEPKGLSYVVELDFPSVSQVHDEAGLSIQ